VHGPRQAADEVRNCGVYVAWVLREWMHGRPGDAEGFPGHLEFRVEMLQLLRGAFRTPRLPSVGDVLGSPSTSMTDIHPHFADCNANDAQQKAAKAMARRISQGITKRPLAKETPRA